jgi:hypothetical protein
VWRSIAIVAGIATLSFGVAASQPSAPVQDAFEARSQLMSSIGVATNFSISLVDFQEMAEAAEKKFGVGAKTVLHGDTGMVETTLDGKVVETSSLKARVVDVFGIFQVGRRRDQMASFPFWFGVDDDRDRPRNVGEMARGRFPQLSDFNDTDWTNLRCWSREASEVSAQFTNADPRLGRTDLCLVRWRRGEPKTMLIGALAADGGDWVRDASRSICRALAAQWLESSEPAVRDNTIDYAACALVHDPDRGARGAADTVAQQLYEVRPDRSLALIN